MKKVKSGQTFGVGLLEAVGGVDVVGGGVMLVAKLGVVQRHGHERLTGLFRVTPDYH